MMALTDEAIVELYVNRDERAIQETDVKYRNYLTKISFNVLHDMEDCEETVNDTYLKAWNSIPPQLPKLLGAYLGKINRQAAIDIYRKKHSAKRGGSEYDLCYEELEETCSGYDSVEQELELSLLGENINKFVKSLSKEKRLVFVGRYFYMDSVKAIAEYTGQSEGSIKTSLFRLRNDLKNYLEKEGFQV